MTGHFEKKYLENHFFFKYTKIYNHQILYSLVLNIDIFQITITLIYFHENRFIETFFIILFYSQKLHLIKHQNEESLSILFF